MTKDDQTTACINIINQTKACIMISGTGSFFHTHSGEIL